MKPKTFREYFNNIVEVHISGNLDKKSFSREYDWNNYWKDSKIKELVFDKLGANHYKLYKVSNTFILTDEQDNYLGNIQGTIKEDSYFISTSQSDVKGFYQIMFTSIFASNIGIKHIYSGDDLSNAAVGSYKKLLKGNFFKVELYDTVTKKYTRFTEDDLIKSNNIICVSDNSNGFLQEYFKKYFEKIQIIEVSLEEMVRLQPEKKLLLEEKYPNGMPGSHKFMYDSYSKDLDNILFGELL